MSVNNSSEHKGDHKNNESGGGKEFIRERISEKPGKKMNLLKVVLLVCILGILFGIMAALSFFISGNVLNGSTSAAEEIQESVSIPRDQMPSETETQTETETETETEPETTVDETKEEVFRETVEDIIDDYLRAQETETEPETEPAMVMKIKGIRNDLKHNLVTVTSQLAEEDVFDHTYTRSLESFGVIVAVTARDVRILTESYLLEGADSVRVTLGNGSVRDAVLMEQETVTGMAVVSIPVSSLDPADTAYVAPAALGNSYLCSEGDMVIALGSPLDHIPSIEWGIISYIRNNEEGTDMNYDLIMTDMIGDIGASGILVNISGEVVGWIKDTGADESRSRISAMSISDLKGMIECLSNGKKISLLGVQVEEITTPIAEAQNLPKGLYITNTISDSPAFNEGIQNGDVLTRINDIELKTVYDLQNTMLELRPGTEVSMIIMREGRDGFTEKEFLLTLGER